MIAWTWLFAFVAGGLSVLSPCVLPILPVVFGAASTSHKWAPAALLGGLVLSFTSLGLFVATTGFTLGLDAEVFRIVGAIALVAFGFVLVVPWLERRFTQGVETISSWITRRSARFTPTGAWGHVGLGLVLGAIWAPCTGPTLGAASLLAAQGHDLAEVALTMVSFGLGAGLPLVLFGVLSNTLAGRWRSALAPTARYVKAGLGIFTIVIGLGIVTGLEHGIESALVRASPGWLVELTTKY